MLAPFIALPMTLILFGLVVALLLAGESAPDSTSLPIALACAVPGLLSGLGMTMIYRRGIATAITSRRGFGLVLPLAVMPETPTVFGVVVSLLLIGAGPEGVTSFGASGAWAASTLAMAGGVGGLLSAWLICADWDFETVETWHRALSKSGRGGTFTLACFAVAMAIIGEWLLALIVVLYFGVTAIFGIAVRKARVRTSSGLKPS